MKDALPLVKVQQQIFLRPTLIVYFQASNRFSLRRDGYASRQSKVNAASVAANCFDPTNKEILAAAGNDDEASRMTFRRKIAGSGFIALLTYAVKPVPFPNVRA
jgi:hypothetical protein